VGDAVGCGEAAGVVIASGLVEGVGAAPSPDGTVDGGGAA
jgi:hypothetical protein